MINRRSDELATISHRYFTACTTEFFSDVIDPTWDWRDKGSINQIHNFTLHSHAGPHIALKINKKIKKQILIYLLVVIAPVSVGEPVCRRARIFLNRELYKEKNGFDRMIHPFIALAGKEKNIHRPLLGTNPMGTRGGDTVGSHYYFHDYAVKWKRARVRQWITCSKPQFKTHKSIYSGDTFHCYDFKRTNIGTA